MENIKSHFSTLLDRIQPSERTVTLGTAIVVGIGTALGAVLFIHLIAFIQKVFFAYGEALLRGIGRILLIAAPTLGGLLAGPIIYFFAREAKGHGVPEVMQAVALRGGRIRPRVVVAKIIASALCIGSGGSAGREGPIVQVGAAIGSTLGQWLHLSEARVRNLVACGAAAGIAATFNAPIAGVIFSLEIILGELHLGDLGGVVISAVTASTLARVFLGERPAFAIPNYGMKTPWEVLLYALLGVLSALLAVLFIKVLYGFEDRFDEWKFPEMFKPAVGGFALGCLAFLYPVILGLGLVPTAEARLGLPVTSNLPHVFGSGFGIIEDALLGKLSFALLFALVFLKPLATSLTLGSGNSGGVFAPALFSGAALGGAFGKLVEWFLPGLTAGPGAFATVGMAAVFAGAARAPFTAILIVFEMTNDYRLIVPLMAAVAVSVLLAEHLHRESIYTLKLVRRGIRLSQGRVVDVMESVQVQEVMMQAPETVSVDMPIESLANEFIRTGRHGFPVLNKDGSLYGVVSLEDYRRAISQEQSKEGELRIRNIATRNPVIVFPDDTVGTALRRMAPRDLSRLPVVSRDDPHRLVGLVRRNDIVRAYELGVVRREEARRRAEVLQSMRDDHVAFVDISLPPESLAVGKSIAELSLPRQAVLVSIRRGKDLLIPHGDTELQAGDMITILCEREYINTVQTTLNQTKSHHEGKTQSV